MTVAAVVGVAFAVDNTRFTLLGMGAGLAINYALSRTRHYTVAAVSSVVLISAQPFVRVFLVYGPLEGKLVVSVFSWLVLGLCTASILFSIRGVLVVAASDVAAMSALLAAGYLPFGMAAAAVILVVSTAILTALAASLRVRQTRATHESEERFHSLFELALEGIAIHDENAILAVNPAFERLFQVRADDVLGRSISEFLIDESMSLSVADMMASEHAQSRHEVTGRRADGSTFGLEVLIRRDQLYRGHPVLVIGLRDLTEQQRVESMLVNATEKAEVAVRTQSEFLANMSHEIRTPMNAIIGLTGLVLDSDLQAQQREYLQIVRDNGEALLTMINRILDFSRVDSGELRVESQSFVLRDCLESALELMGYEAAAKGLELGYRIAPTVPVAITSDPTRLRQILVNLLGNAIKFTDSGEVMITVDAAPKRMDSKGPIWAQTINPDDGGVSSEVWRIRFSIRDTGIGIPAAEHDRLFDPFQQLDGSSTRKYEGTGLGLAICERLTAMLGGRIWLDSSPGEGSTFHFTISAKQATCELPAHLDLTSRRLRHKRLLVVIGNRSQRGIVVESARAWGMSVVSASSLNAAQAIINLDETLDAVVLGADMAADMRQSLARTIRAHLRHADAAIIGLVPMDANVDDVDIAPLDALVRKPIKLEALYSAITCRMPARESFTDFELVTLEGSEPALADSLPPLRILVADDNVVNQQLAVHLLSQLGYRGDVVSDGQEAVEAVSRQDYDVVLMDVDMPTMDGLEATRQIRRGLKRPRQPWIIAVSADVAAEAHGRITSAGMDDLVAKPVQLSPLVSALRRIS